MRAKHIATISRLFQPAYRVNSQVGNGNVAIRRHFASQAGIQDGVSLFPKTSEACQGALVAGSRGSRNHQSSWGDQMGGMLFASLGSLGVVGKSGLDERNHKILTENEYAMTFPPDQNFWVSPSILTLWPYDDYVNFKLNLRKIGSVENDIELGICLSEVISALPVKNMRFDKMNSKQFMHFALEFKRLTKELDDLYFDRLNKDFSDKAIDVLLDVRKQVGLAQCSLDDQIEAAQALLKMEDIILSLPSKDRTRISQYVNSIVENPNYSGCLTALVGTAAQLALVGPAAMWTEAARTALLTGASYSVGYSASYVYLLKEDHAALERYRKKCPRQAWVGGIILVVTLVAATGHVAGINAKTLAQAAGVDLETAKLFLADARKLGNALGKDLSVNFIKSCATKYPRVAGIMKKAAESRFDMVDGLNKSLCSSKALSRGGDAGVYLQPASAG